jgi:hypothetical protein
MFSGRIVGSKFQLTVAQALMPAGPGGHPRLIGALGSSSLIMAIIVI